MSGSVVRWAGQLVLITGVAVLGTIPGFLTLAVATAAAGTALLWWPTSRPWLPALVFGDLAVAVATTAGYRFLDWPGLPPSAVLELPLLAILAALAARARHPLPLSAATAVAAGCAFLRADAAMTPLDALYGAAFWALIPVSAAVVSAYFRHQRTAREQAVEAARRDQRLDLAHDLHDYVAHDVSEIIAQAQAAQLFVGENEQVLGALRRIETAGQAAMASLDRTVHTLHAERRHPVPGLDELAELTERFAAAGDTRVALTVAPNLGRVPRELTSTVHRVVVEALTNIRRHARSAETVEVRVYPVDDQLAVSVVDSGSPPSTAERRSGLGLPALTERVDALAGTLDAGPHGDGWRVLVTLPLARP
jgi:signal transduction histidine kinase